MAKKRFFQESELVFAEKPNHGGLFKDLTSQHFSRLCVLGFAGVKGKNATWYCKCDCGKIVAIPTARLKSNKAKSCGCYASESASKRMTTHGYGTGKIVSYAYKSWNAMMSRCFCKSDQAYHRYGGSGITVCDRWLKFENFLADMGERPKELDRKENDKGYCPENCRWATPTEQANNLSNNRLLTFNGETKSASQWAKEKGIPTSTLFGRISKNWPIEKILSTKQLPLNITT
jgi:hypothetical protein